MHPSEENSMKIPSRFLPIAAMILLPAVARTMPYVVGALGNADVHDPALFLLHLSPVSAVFLFGGAMFADRRWAYLAPLAAMLVSDLAIAILLRNVSMGFHAMTPVLYGSYALTIWLGTLLAKMKGALLNPASWFQNGAPSRRWLAMLVMALATAGAGIAGEVIFFITTNFATWVIQDGYYPHTGAGLVACYIAGIPFFRHLLSGMAVYGVVLFGGFALLEWRFAPARQAAAETPKSNQVPAA
jgi:hypothetical protein